jgi:hypothetical protein
LRCTRIRAIAKIQDCAAASCPKYMASWTPTCRPAAGITLASLGLAVGELALPACSNSVFAGAIGVTSQELNGVSFIVAFSVIFLHIVGQLVLKSMVLSATRKRSARGARFCMVSIGPHPAIYSCSTPANWVLRMALPVRKGGHDAHYRPMN